MSDINNSFIAGVVEGFYGRPWTTAQRKHLFTRMKSLGLNTYMYAPKDDFKHRAYWREPYSVEESEQLTALISLAKENDITFYYALSPGLDITFSSSKDVNFLKRKLEQVSQFGCEAFALLFDDIEPEISEIDKEIFQSFGHAQVSISNEVYQSLGSPKFLFCPTEYCSSRAIPNVQSSEYLNTIGSKLHPSIDIMWTGTKVITKVISLQSIQELSDVLKRSPVIWDNIHANDYDQKRVFLGPYSGRSTELNSHLRGVLTNPNCEYGPNFVAIHTLAQWSKCNNDVKCDMMSSDIRLETENDVDTLETISSRIDAHSYHPKNALRIALKEWLQELNEPKSSIDKPELVSAPIAALLPTLTNPPVQPEMPVIHLLPVICESNEDNLVNGKKPDIDSAFQPITKELVNSLVSPPLIINPLEPMDCNASPDLSPKQDSQMFEKIEKDEPKEETEAMQTESPAEIDEQSLLTYEDLSLLVDFFYLPFEHGAQGIHFLNEFYWLKTNYQMAQKSDDESVHCDVNIDEWIERANKFHDLTGKVAQLFDRILNCRNRSVVYELYSYVWDFKETAALLDQYVKFLAMGKVPFTQLTTPLSTFTWFSKGYKETFSSGDQEPWIFRGGLVAELQKLLNIEGSPELFSYKLPELSSSHNCVIRPLSSADEKKIYEIYAANLMNCNSNSALNTYPDLPADLTIGGLLTLSPEYGFVSLESNTINCYVVASLDSRKFYDMQNISWIPEMRSKYPIREDLDVEKEMLDSLHTDSIEMTSLLPEVVYKYPSLIHINTALNVDINVAKRLLTYPIVALKAHGSQGIHSRVPVEEKNTIDFYIKLGFHVIQIPCEEGSNESHVFLGRLI